MTIYRYEGLERILWSIAFPGFGQILNKHLFKGVLFIILEFIINVQSKINLALKDSFYGDTESAVKVINYEWFMFYPCIYMFAMWDAYISTKGEKPIFISLPFIFSAILSTIGIIFSPSVRIFGFLLGPIWLPILCIILGTLIGIVVMKFLAYNTKEANPQVNIQALLHDANTAIFVVNKDGTFTYMNKRSFDMAYEPEKIQKLGDTLAHTKYYDVNGKEIKKEESPCLRILNGDIIQNVVLKAVRPDKIAYYNYNGIPIYTAKGEIAYAIIFMNDITEQIMENNDFSRFKLKLMPI